LLYTFKAEVEMASPGLWRPKIGTLRIIAITPQFARCRFGKRPPSKMCTSQHTHYAGGIKVVTLHEFTMEPTKEYNITTKTPWVKKPIIHTKIQIIHKANSIRVWTKNTNGPKRPEDNDGVHNPAQAKPEG
jgi:hypothetical protein